MKGYNSILVLLSKQHIVRDRPPRLGKPHLEKADLASDLIPTPPNVRTYSFAVSVRGVNENRPLLPFFCWLSPLSEWKHRARGVCRFHGRNRGAGEYQALEIRGEALIVAALAGVSVDKDAQITLLLL